MEDNNRFKVFEDEALNELFYKTRDDIKLSLSPVIDQIVLINLQMKVLPPSVYGTTERHEEERRLKEYCMGMIHQILGYEQK